MKRIVFLVVLFSSIALSAQPFNRGNNRFGDCGREVWDKLNLTEEQESKLETKRFEHQEFMIETRAEIEKTKLELSKALAEDEIDMDKVKGINSKLSELHTKIHDSRFNMMIDVYNELDDSQKKEWSKHIRFKLNGPHAGISGRDRGFGKKGRF